LQHISHPLTNEVNLKPDNSWTHHSPLLKVKRILESAGTSNSKSKRLGKDWEYSSVVEQLLHLPCVIVWILELQVGKRIYQDV
jgi:hypothetical protein